MWPRLEKTPHKVATIYRLAGVHLLHFFLLGSPSLPPSPSPSPSPSSLAVDIISMPSFVPLLFYDQPTSSSQPQHADHHHSGHAFSDGASSVSAIIQNQMAQATPRLGPETSAIAGNGKSLPSRYNAQTTDRQKLKKALRKKSQRANQCIDTCTLTGNKSDHELKDATSIVKDETMREDEVTLKAKHFVNAVRAVKKAVYTVQMALFEGVQRESQLQAASTLLTEFEYGNVIIERSISQLCGFPLCKQPLQSNSPHRGHYRISLREHKVYDTQEQKLFCSSYCLIASKTFAIGLQADREGTAEQEKLNEIIAAVHGLGLSQDTPVSTAVKEADANLKVHESSHSSFEDFENVGSLDAIEGYVPQKFQRRGDLSSCKEQDDPLSALDIDKPTNLELKSALSGTRKKHGVHVTWADDFDMVPEFKGSQLGVIEVANPEPKGPVVLTSHMLETATVESTRCLVDAGSSNMSRELDTSNTASELVEPVVDLGTLSKNRLASAEALAFALTEAAAATEAGELEPSEAEFGISICAAFDDDPKPSSSGLDGITEENPVPKDRARPEWLNEEDDLQSSDSMNIWFDTPPSGFKLELSMFGTIWMALEEWISSAAIAFIYGRENEGRENFSSLNGREYKQQIMLDDGVSAEISRTLSSCISRVLPDVVQAIHLSIPVSVLEQALGRLLRSMNFVEALPALNTKQWRMIVALFLDALSVQRLPALGAQLGNNRALLRKVINSSGLSDAEYEAYKDLILPLGRLPSFATMSGG